jgi:hypothetical protein
MRLVSRFPIFCRVDAGRCTALQRAKRIEIDGITTVCHQEGIDEREVAVLVLGVVVDVLGHVHIQHLQGRLVPGNAGATGVLAVLDAAQLVVLFPQVGFEDFGGRQEPEDGHIAWGETTTGWCGERRHPLGQQFCADSSGRTDREPLA